MKMIILAGMAAMAPLAAAAQEAPEKQAIIPEGMEGLVSDFEYSPAVRAGDMVYLAGVVGGSPGGDQASDEELRAGFVRAFETVAQVLETAGAGWGDVVEMTTYHTDLPRQIDIFFEVRSEYVSAPFPAWTAIDIDRLYPDNGTVEIKVVAYAPQDAQE